MEGKVAFLTMTLLKILFQQQLLITHRQGLEITWMVYLHTPRVFHSLMVLSREPETIWRLSAEKATLKTSLVWPTNRRVVTPLGKTPNRSKPL